MHRMGVDPILIKATTALYKQPQLNIEMDQHISEWHAQATGIRQGCPLSPYLFTIIMAVMFHDINNIPHNRALHRVIGTNYDVVLYADDTACITEDTKCMNQLLRDIEVIGLKYGLKLNKAKCEILETRTQTGLIPNVHFPDNTPVKVVQEVKYLGGKIHYKRDTQIELRENIRTCMLVLQRLLKLWRNSNVTIKFKLIAADAVLRTKLLYGVEMQLTPSMERN